jgi:AcrR family transcriptional regulator
VAQIVSVAGVSRRTFYELFEDRDECFLAAFDYVVARIAKLVGPAWEAERRWQDRVRASLTALLGFLDEERAMGKFVFVETLGAGPTVLARRERVLMRIAAAVDEGRTVDNARAPLPSITAEGVVGAVSSVLHTRLLSRDPTPLIKLTSPLMSMIVLPYLGVTATRAELQRPSPRVRVGSVESQPDGDFLKSLGMRITYRTLRVLQSVGKSPGASNRQIGEDAGISDQGQISKLLHRLERVGLLANSGSGLERGAPNEWTLTARGETVAQMIDRS